MDVSPECADSLQARLQAIAERIAHTSPGYIAAAEACIRRLEAAGAGLAAPAEGATLPPFLLPDSAGGLVSLDSLAGRPVVLMFMRGHWCNFCNAQAESLAEAADALRETGAAVVVITPELPRFAGVLAPEGPGVHLLCDLDNGYAATLGLMSTVDEDLAVELRKFDIDLPAFHGARGWALPIPATFVLDTESRIVFRAIDPDFRRRPSLSAILEPLARSRL